MKSYCCNLKCQHFVAHMYIDLVDLKSDFCQWHWFSCLREWIILPLLLFFSSYLYVSLFKMAIIFIFVLSFPVGFLNGRDRDKVTKKMMCENVWSQHGAFTPKLDLGQLNTRCSLMMQSRNQERERKKQTFHGCPVSLLLLYIHAILSP